MCADNFQNVLLAYVAIFYRNFWLASMNLSSNSKDSYPNTPRNYLSVIGRISPCVHPSLDAGHFRQNVHVKGGFR